jgi:N-glycosylase/DNA lyase
MIAKIVDEKTVWVFDKPQFDWHAIRNCGQIFIDPPCVITEQADKIILTACDDWNAKKLWEYFDLETDYTKIQIEIMKNLPDNLLPVVAAGRGIRILRQDFKRTVISFIVSANNNIKRFSKTLAQIDFSNLSNYTADDFRLMGCGYRAPYLVSTIKMLEKPPFDSPHTITRKNLLTLPGVGAKVADCILLFALHKLDVAPVDTWIKRALEKLGKEVLKGTYAGVLQQYIFYYTQHLRKEI